jgi:hypothetical protein
MVSAPVDKEDTMRGKRISLLQERFYHLARRWEELGAPSLARWMRSWAQSADDNDPHHWGHLVAVSRDIEAITRDPRDREFAERSYELAMSRYQMMFIP